MLLLLMGTHVHLYKFSWFTDIEFVEFFKFEIGDNAYT